MRLSAYVYSREFPKTKFILTLTSTIIPLEIWDCPGNITVETLGAPLSQFATMIFVIDIRVGRVASL